MAADPQPESGAGRPPRVLRVIARLNIGGPSRHAAILEQGLSVLGFESLLVHGTPTEDEGSFEVLLSGCGGRSVRVPGLGRRIRPWSDLVALGHLVRLVFRESPDIIHTHTAKAGTLGRLAGIVFNATQPRGRHCLLIHTFHGHVMSGYFSGIGTAATRLVERTLAWWTDRIVTISDRQRDEIARHLGLVGSKKIVVIPLGLNLDELLSATTPDRTFRDELGYGPGDFVVGYVGRLVPIKDLGTMLAGFAGLRRERPDARLLLVGDGEVRSSLEGSARALGVEDAVTFVGWRHDLTRVYGAMDVAALTSRNEGTPVALIEAMAAGLPVVATTVGGVSDVVRDEGNGLLIPPGNPQALAAALSRLAADPSLRGRLGAEGRVEVCRRFGGSRLVADVAALYRDLLQEGRQARAGTSR